MHIKSRRRVYCAPFPSRFHKQDLASSELKKKPSQSRHTDAIDLLSEAVFLGSVESSTRRTSRKREREAESTAWLAGWLAGWHAPMDVCSSYRMKERRNMISGFSSLGTRLLYPVSYTHLTLPTTPYV